MRYSLEPKDLIYVKWWVFFATNMGKNLSNKFSQKRFDGVKKSTTDAIKTASKKAIKKTAEAEKERIKTKELKMRIWKWNKDTKRMINISRKKTTNYWWIKISIKYQKTINFLDNVSNQPSKFRSKNWAEINESRGTYNIGAQIKFNKTTWKSSLCDYSEAYILVKLNITVNNTAADDADANNTNKKVIFKNCLHLLNA